MTTIKLSQNEIKVNGRTVYDTVSVANLEKVSGGVWAGKTEWGDTFRVIGGGAAGGGRNEWFLEYPHGFGDQAIRSNSAVNCFKMMGRV
jgi:hypothetical protein